MKTFKTNKNNLKQNIMYRLTFLFSVLFALNATAKINKDNHYLNLDNAKINSEKIEVEHLLFVNAKDSNYAIIDVSAVKVLELEEEVELGFDTTNYLPENFNVLKGMYDLDWTSIELVEIEEEVEIGFDTTNYLPENFNALKGKSDLDWTSIELVEIEEEVEIGFDTKAHLPNDFNPYVGMHKGEVEICLN